MADVSHELGSLRFVVDSPLSSKVAMFNKQSEQHKQSQLMNPFSNTDGGRCSPKPTFSKTDYGKPLAGSLTEMRGQKANIHVLKEMIELCHIIHSEGYDVKDESDMRVIPFGELFNIYNYISDKVVGILLRARKHKLVEFEGEMLFQRRDDDVPIFLLRPIKAIREELEAKIEDIKRASSPAPQSTSVLLDRSAHEQKLQEAGLIVPGCSNQKRNSLKSRSLSPSSNKKSPSPVRESEMNKLTSTSTMNLAPQMLTIEKETTIAQQQQQQQQLASKQQQQQQQQIDKQMNAQPEIFVVNEDNKTIHQNDVVAFEQQKNENDTLTTTTTITDATEVIITKEAEKEVVQQQTLITENKNEETTKILTENVDKHQITDAVTNVAKDAAVNVAESIVQNFEKNLDENSTIKSVDAIEVNVSTADNNNNNNNNNQNNQNNNENNKTDINNNETATTNELPTVIIEETSIHIQNDATTAEHS